MPLRAMRGVMPLFLKALSDIEGSRRPCVSMELVGALPWVDHDEACGSARWHPRLLRRPSNHGRWLPSGSPRGERLLCREQCGASSPICPYLSDSWRSFDPPGGGYACRVQRCSLPVDLLCLAQPIQQGVRCNSSHTPASCHSLSLRQQVIPEPQPISLGSISQGIPLLSTNRMPLRAARSSMRGLPPWGLGGSSGSSGSIISQSSSLTSSLAMLSPYPLPGFVRRT
jgi:hypothetical protein